MLAAALLVVVFGWSVGLSWMIDTARQEIGLPKRASSALVMLCWVPIISVAGIIAPQVFLGRDAAKRLRESAGSRRWLGYVRLGALLYLALMIAVPLVAAMTDVVGRR
jgi:hypothetical protein